MKIETVGITYSELRTFGNYENKRYGITLEASLEAGETASCVKAKLTEIAKTQVKEFFDGKTDDQMDIPF